MYNTQELPRRLRRPVPISAVDRVLIDRFVKKTGIVYVPLGASGDDDEKAADRRSWTGHRFGQSEKFRLQQSQQRQLLRALVDDGKTGREIAALVGLKLDSVYSALSRLGLKIRPTSDEPHDV